MQFIGYGRQSISEDDIEAVVRVLRDQPLTCGPMIESFEAAICEVTGAKHAIAVANGTCALRLAYQAAGIGPDSIVGVPAITFVATASQAMLLGAEVVMLDVDPRTGNLTPEILDGVSIPLTHVVAVHVAGQMVDLAGLEMSCERRGVTLLEDASHALGSTMTNGMRCGNGAYTELATLSFHPVKNITTAEGGAVVTSNEELARQIRSLRHHGIIRGKGHYTGSLSVEDGESPWYHEFHQPSTNDRLSDLHAALGLSQIKRIQQFKEARQAVHDRYSEAFAELPMVHPPKTPIDQAPFWHLCATAFDWEVLGKDRKALFTIAQQRQIGLQVHYIPLHLQPVCAQLRRSGSMQGAESFYHHAVSLPCYPDLSEADQARVIEMVRDFCEV